MSFPYRFEFTAGDSQKLKLTITDEHDASVTDATVTGTLYANRSKEHPKVTPGTAVTGFTALTAVQASPVTNIYTIAIDGATFDPTPGDNYVCVVDCISVLSGRRHLEVPSSVIVGKGNPS